MKPRSRDLVEIGLNAPFWIGWIALINAGTENGIGYFHQPGHDLLLPLVNGAIFNAAAFVGNAFWLMPCYLRPHRFGRYFGGMALLLVGVIVLKTLAERLIILVSMPDLLDLPSYLLALENLYGFFAMVLLSLCYRFGRDWFLGNPPRPVARPIPNESSPEEIWIKNGTSVERVAIGDIRFVEAADNYVAFVLPKRRLLTLMTMSSALERLPAERFLRIHRCYIVSLKDVRRVVGNRLDLADVTLPIGKTYRKEARRRLEAMVSE